MKESKVILVCVLVVVACSTRAIAQKPASESCADNASTQAAMNECERATLQEMKREMSVVLGKLLAKRKKFPQAQTKLKASQAAWEKYVDSHLQAMYPSRFPEKEYGSIHAMCDVVIRTELTRERLAILKKMLDPEEGEVCVNDPSWER